MKRPEWDEFWLVQALMYSTRATCDRLLAATVLVDKNNRLISAGYNGSASGMPHCDEEGHCLVDGHCKTTIHSEDNALSKDRFEYEGASAYVVYSPCLSCAKKLIDAGVKKIFYLREFTNMAEGEKVYLKKLVMKKGVVFEHVGLDPRELIENAVNILKSKGGALWPPSC